MKTNEDYSFLISKFSHELRNPLTSVYSSLQLMEMKFPEIKEYKYWKAILEDMDYIFLLMNDFSNFSSERFQMESFSLDAVLKQVALSFAASVMDTKISFTSRIDIPGEVHGDYVKLQEVFRNLLKNAAEAIDSQGEIYLDASRKDDHIIILVKDTGCGISKEQLGTIFDPFVTYKKQGSGLGLPICKHIVEAHQGSIQVTSEVGVGTVLQITLPA